MRYLLKFSLVVIFISVGCNQKEDVILKNVESPSLPVDQQLITYRPVNPNDVTYSIIDLDTMPGIKRSLNIRLSQKTSKQKLRDIALQLKAQDPRNYERTFICYFLPDMTVGAGAWATTHFNPKLEVNILGLTIEEEYQLVTQVESTNHQIIGCWIDDAVLGSCIAIYKKSNKLFMEQMFSDGSSLKNEIIERESNQGRRFDKVKHSTSGDHWVILPNGILQTRDNEGLISTARRVQR